ncbi:MAG: hypothetical protein IKK24_04510 [Clostridia bacterium]|nr:hypothetical protein [Clostridia bacterium]
MKKITIIGGDRRLRITKERLEKEGFIVDTLGLYEKDNGNPENSDVMLFPVPTTKDGKTVFCPLTERVLKLSDFDDYDGKLFLTANYKFANKDCIDYCTTDGYALLNAVPTAEGAISFAIENTPFTLWNSKVLVIGYGRTGKILAERLKGFKCDLTVSARKTADFALLEANGINYCHTSELDNTHLDYDIIFNTIDFYALKENLVTLKNTLLIDLSSKGGFDFNRAKDLGISCKKLPGIPGKTAPQTAGEILAKTVISLIRGEKI